MAWYTPKEWKDRLVEFAGRRTLKNVSTNETTVYDVTRNEGAVSQEGDSFSAAKMNDFDLRVKNAIDAAEEAYTQLSGELEFPDGTKFYPDIKDGEYGFNTAADRGADTFHPFKKITSDSFNQLQCETMNSTSPYTINLDGYDGYIVIVHATAGTYPTASGCNCVNIGKINSGASNGSSGNIYFCPSGGTLSVSSATVHRGYTVIGISS